MKHTDTLTQKWLTGFPLFSEEINGFMTLTFMVKYLLE